MKRKKQRNDSETQKSKVRKQKREQTIFNPGDSQTQTVSYTEEVLHRLFNKERVISLQDFLELLCQNYPTLFSKYQNYKSTIHNEKLNSSFGTIEDLLSNLIIVLPQEDLQSKDSNQTRESLIFGSHRTKLPEDEHRINFDCSMPLSDLILRAISSLLVTSSKSQDVDQTRGRLSRSHSFPSASTRIQQSSSSNASSSNNSLRWQNILTRGFQYQRQPFRHQIGISFNFNL